MKRAIIVIPALVFTAFVLGCASRQLCRNMKLVSTGSKVSESENVRKSSRVIEVSTWYLCGIPLGDKTSPQEAFNRLNEGADYVNNLELKPSGWSFNIPLNENFSIGISKRSWTASGTVVTKE